ncbi:hypothetical protein [Dactylosporangium sp. CA-233914]|uniref:hypothetical protein n=1 Tax=Dactylosporangium sp. CA-233914 TaxID=3239934 RepID=UPI003D903867
MVEQWSTGAEVRQAAEFRHEPGRRATLILAGTCLQAITEDGRTLFRLGDLVVTRVLHVAEIVRGAVALVLVREREVVLLDLNQGTRLWSYTAPEGTLLSGPGSSKLMAYGDGLCWLVAPGYAETISCFDIDASGAVRLRWERDFAGRYDRGFGPVLIVDDITGSGRDQLLISTRTGSAYGDEERTEGHDVPTEKVVLGRADGHLYQAVIDLRDGSTVTDVAYRPDPGDYPCARPYGLLQVVASGDDRYVVQVSCQVEEYYAVTRADGHHLERAWGEFVEKDAPIDEQELRPQISSVVPGPDPRLIVGHFDGTEWRTLVRSVATGEIIESLPGHYYWGTLQMPDGAALAIVSPAGRRRLDGTEGLRTFRLDGSGRLSTIRSLAPVTCDEGELPPDVSFHAARRSLLPLARADGTVGLLTADGDRLVWWDPAADECVELGRVGVVAGYPGLDGAVLLVGQDSTVYRVDRDLSLSAGLHPVGRRPHAVAAVAGPSAWLISSRGDGTSQARSGTACYELAGRPGALAVDGAALLVATIVDAAGSVRVWRSGPSGFALLGEIISDGAPDHALFIDDPWRVVVSEHTGVHTAAVGCYQLDGTPVWRDERWGAHPNFPLAAVDRQGRRLVSYDDHGVLLLRDGHTGVELARRDWTAAYTTPAIVDVDGEQLLLRLGGVHGVEAVDLELRERWRLTTELMRYYPGEAAVAYTAGGPVIGSCGRDGVLDLLDVRTGAVTASTEVGAVAGRPPVVAMALAPDRDPSFVVGTADGRLVTVDPNNGAARPWPLVFEAAVEYLAVAETSDGFCELVVGTSDGMLHRVAC